MARTVKASDENAIQAMQSFISDGYLRGAGQNETDTASMVLEKMKRWRASDRTGPEPTFVLRREPQSRLRVDRDDLPPDTTCACRPGSGPCTLCEWLEAKKQARQEAHLSQPVEPGRGVPVWLQEQRARAEKKQQDRAAARVEGQPGANVLFTVKVDDQALNFGFDHVDGQHFDAAVDAVARIVRFAVTLATAPDGSALHSVARNEIEVALAELRDYGVIQAQPEAA